MQQRQDEQGRTVITVLAVGSFGPAVERKMRERAKSDAYRIGYRRVRKLRTTTAEGNTQVEYVAYSPKEG